MSVLYPLRFHPILRRYLWGGRRLETLGKSLGPGNDYAESWEIVDHGADQSMVAYGPLAGRTLGELRARPSSANCWVATRRSIAFRCCSSFSTRTIAFRSRCIPTTREPHGSIRPISARPRPGSSWPPSRAVTCTRACAAASTAKRSSAKSPGAPASCASNTSSRAWAIAIFCRPACVHALGPGLLVAEIQQASDTTYRLYDWGRLGPDGQPRKLHVEPALDAIDYSYGPVAAQRPQPTDTPGVERLVACDKFVLDRSTIDGAGSVGGDDRCHILAVVEGTLDIAGDPPAGPLAPGDVALLPAALAKTASQGSRGCCAGCLSALICAARMQQRGVLAASRYRPDVKARFFRLRCLRLHSL